MPLLHIFLGDVIESARAKSNKESGCGRKVCSLLTRAAPALVPLTAQMHPQYVPLTTLDLV